MALVFALLCAFGCPAVTGQPKWETNFRIKIVATAESQLHVREATGSNDGKDIKKYLEVTGLGEGYPWCAAFVSWVFEEAGGTGPRSARVVDWFKSNIVYKSEWRQQNITPEPGMVIGLYYPKLGRYGHIGIVDKVHPGQLHTIITIEGNTNAAGSREGQGVYRKIRPWKSIAVMADHCVQGQRFINRYDELIQKSIQ